jgi:hypothetical protein
LPVPVAPKLYHIVHRDRLPSIVRDGFLLSDATMAARLGTGTTIGMGSIKKRRLEEIELDCYPGLFVGQCVPFYFCPRSVMLYIIHQANHVELTYKGGQQPIVHLELDLRALVNWAETNRKRWLFTLSNAGSFFFEERVDLDHLCDLNWEAIDTRKWAGRGVSTEIKEGKQAEFLVEDRVPWTLVGQIGVHNRTCAQLVANSLHGVAHRPPIRIFPDWYY